MNQLHLAPFSSFRLRAFAAGLLASLALTSAPAAQRADALVRADLAFASGLSERYRYADLAENVIGTVESGGVTENMSETVALTKCDVLANGARFSGNPEERLELHVKALEAYDSFLEDYPYSDLVTDAERAYVDITNRYAQHLEQDLQEAVGAEAETLRESIKETLDGGLERVRTLIETYEDDPELSPSEELEMYGFVLRRGQMLTTRAQIAEDGTFYFAQAEQVLEDLAAAMDQTSMGLQAYLQLAKVKSLQGEYLDAADFAAYVVDFVVPMDPAAREDPNWTELSQDERQRRFRIVQLGMVDLLEAYNNAGESASAVDAALYYYNVWKSEGYELNPLGYLSLLGVAKTLLDAGGFVGGGLVDGNLQWFETSDEMSQAGFRSGRESRSAIELALRTAKEVNEANRGNVLQVRAQKLISEIVDRPGVALSPDVLLEAAEGELNSRNYPAALNTYKRLLALLDRQDDATKLDQMPSALNGIAKCLERLERPLEAAMAYREAATTWKGDPEFQVKNAEGYYRALEKVRRSDPSDDLIGSLYLQAENLVAEAAAGGGGSVEIHWKKGERAYRDKDYAAARQEYLLVDPGDEAYEKALVKATLCTYKLGDLAGANDEFESYLTSFVPDPANTVTTKDKIDAREAAKAMATYYVGFIAKKNGDWTRVETWLDDFDEKFGTQKNYAATAMRLLLQAKEAQKDFAGVRDVLERMRTKYGAHPQTAAAAGDAAGALKGLIEAAVKDEDAEKADRLRAERAQYLNLANEASTKPSFSGLRNESSLWVELEEWEKAEAALRKLVAAFGKDDARAKDMQRFVLPDLGLALLEQKRVPEALEVLDPLVPDPDDKDDPRRPGASTVRHWARAISGWVEGDADTIVEVPGAGADDAAFEKATKLYLQLTRQEERENKWECAWYELKFENFYAFYRWGQLDSSKLASTKGFLEDLRSAAQDPEFLLVTEKCGGETLRKRFLWLWDKVR